MIDAYLDRFPQQKAFIFRLFYDIDVSFFL